MAAKITLVAILIFSMVIPFLGYYLGQKKEKSFKASLAVNLVLFFAAGLCMVQGHIRFLEQGLEIIPIPWADSDPNTAGNAALSGQFLQYPVKAFQDTVRNRHDLALTQRSLKHGHELIPADTRYNIAASEQM